MKGKVQLDLGEVQETLLVPLFGRAQETRRNGVLSDHKAIEIVESLDYNFEKLKNKPSLLETATRTVVYDHLLKKIIAGSGSATVVELGCGLNTRKDRIANDQLTWFNLDMPDVYEVWKLFFKEGPKNTFLPYSAFDEKWVKEVKAKSKPPYVFLSEASTIYFDEDKNKELFEMLAQNFPGCYYIFDTATDYFIRNQTNNNALQFYSARLKWSVNDVDEIARWNPDYQLIKQINFYLYPPKHIKHKIPWSTRFGYQLLSIFNRQAAHKYMVNLFRLYH